MKSDEDVRMISAEAPVLFAKVLVACCGVSPVTAGALGLNGRCADLVGRGVLGRGGGCVWVGSGWGCCCRAGAS